MIKNKGLIFKMSLEQKIRLITSATYGVSCAVENYEFPVFRLSPNPVADTGDIYTTHFPSDKALACTWNLSLVSDVYKCVGNEAKGLVDYAYFNVSNNLPRENISEDYYLTGKFLGAKARGVNESGATVNFEDAPAACNEVVFRESVKQITDFILKDASPDSLLTESKENIESYPEIYRYKGLFYGLASSKEDVARLLYMGCSLVFTRGDFSEELPLYIEELTKGYDRAYDDYKAHIIRRGELDKRARNLEILDMTLVNEACDRLIDLMLSMREQNADSIDEAPAALDKESHDAVFNEALHDKIALEAARQSAVLLKNSGILPLHPALKAAVLGDSAKNPAYRGEITRNYSTFNRMPFDTINEYDIQTVGYAHGYEKGESGREDVIERALGVCKDADFALVYLSAERGARALPAGQTELIDALYAQNIRIVAVVEADGVIDFSFEEKCEAVLFCHRGGQACPAAALDILTGRVCPSGRLIDTVPFMTEGYGYWQIPAYCTADKDSIRYPFGYGLSYTSFEYTNLKINEQGVSCNITNTGNCDGYVTVQMYVQKEDSQTVFSNRVLRGFTKVFVKKGDCVKAEIPFTANTFRSFRLKDRCDVVEGGTFRVFLADNADDVRLTGSLNLEGYTYDKTEVYGNEPEERKDGVPVGFTVTGEEQAIRNAKKEFSFGFRLFLALALMLYYDVMGGVLLFTNLIGSKNLIFYIVVGVLLFIGNLIGIIYIVKAAKKRKYQKYLHPNDVIGDMVDRVGEFDEIARVSYRQPVESEEAEEEFIPEPEEEEEEKEEEEVVVEEFKTYDSTFSASAASERKITAEVSLNEMCANFRAFARSKGITVELSSTRALFAAISASKIVMLDTKNRDLLPAFLDVLTEYFGCGGYMAADDSWSAPENLLWQAEEDKYVTSVFANAVYAAGTQPEKSCIALLSEVNPENVRSYFRDFIAYALYPSEEHTLVLNEELSLRLPDNIAYILVPKQDAAEELPLELAHAAMCIEAVISKAEEVGEETEIKSVSAKDTAELVREAREKFFLSENIWKRIDELVETVSAKERFFIGNKNTLQLEKLTAVLMECGADESEAFQTVFTAKLVPLLRLLNTYKEEGGDKTVFGIIEKLFAEEDVSRIKKQLVHGA